ncbi:MAG: DNA primase [Rickettsiales bacterium]|nr:DNA primase [Rickettsiales bacterium]
MYNNEHEKHFINYEELVNEIKTFSISNVIGRYVKLKHSGSGKWLCLCPFHHEKTPSCNIDDREGFFKCFGCGEGGDVIKFIEKIKGCDFKQAIDYLCDILGIDKTKYIVKTTSKQQNIIDKQQVFVNTTKIVAEYYRNNLLSNKEAYSYVLNIRNLNEDTIKEFLIGFADNDVAGLLNFCKQNNVCEEDVISAGILRQSLKTEYNGGKYLFFRDRIMIPIHNVSGKIVAFGGRIFKTNDNNAKYLNSPENDYFKKGSLLFNLNRAKKFLDRNNALIIVEGYMDVISLWQAGIKTAVAPLGTSITEKHLATILNICKTPIFVFDNDVAGQRASIRACEMLMPMLKTGILPRFCTLNGAKDVDEFLQKYFAESLRGQFDIADEINVFLFKNKVKQYDIKNPNQKAKLEKELNDCISKIDDDILKKNYKDFFRKTLWKVISADFGNKKQYVNSTNNNFGFLQNKINTSKLNIDIIEKQIVACILNKQELMDNEDFIDNVLMKMNKKNRNIIDDLPNDKDRCEIFLQKYLPNINNDEIVELFNSLLLVHKSFLVSKANIGDAVKDAEKRKIIEKKKKMLEKQCK